MRATRCESHLCEPCVIETPVFFRLWVRTLDPRAVTDHGAIQHIGERKVDNSDNWFAVFNETDLHGEVAVAVDESISAVEWIDHPNARLAKAAFGVNRFFSKYAIAGELLFQSADD